MCVCVCIQSVYTRLYRKRDVKFLLISDTSPDSYNIGKYRTPIVSSHL